MISITQQDFEQAIYGSAVDRQEFLSSIPLGRFSKHVSGVMYYSEQRTSPAGGKIHVATRHLGSGVGEPGERTSWLHAFPRLFEAWTNVVDLLGLLRHHECFHAADWVHHPSLFLINTLAVPGEEDYISAIEELRALDYQQMMISPRNSEVYAQRIKERKTRMVSLREASLATMREGPWEYMRLLGR